jgi:hypothetical protein
MIKNDKERIKRPGPNQGKVERKTSRCSENLMKIGLVASTQ